MSNVKHSALLAFSQPMQNPAPLQQMAHSPDVDIQVAYLSLPEDTQLWQGQECLNKQVFDTPMLRGYPWVYLPNFSFMPSLSKFYGLLNPGIVSLVLAADCCVAYGHAYISFWLAILTAKLMGKPLILSTDATYLDPIDGNSWKVPLKKKIFPFLYNSIADAVLVPSTAGKKFIHSLGVPEKHIFVTPYVVDNEAIATTARQTDHQKIRATWNIPKQALVVVFCAKFIDRKRPHDLLHAFAKAQVPNSYLVFVGDGPLGDSLRADLEDLGIQEQVRFLGFVKYSKLPEVYAASDILVHPADWEPYGLIVNEAMVCGKPVIVSDRVGAGYDLVQEGVTGFTYPCTDVSALAERLKQILGDRDTLAQMGAAAQRRMKTWSSRENADVTIEAIETTITNKKK